VARGQAAGAGRAGAIRHTTGGTADHTGRPTPAAGDTSGRGANRAPLATDCGRRRAGRDRRRVAPGAPARTGHHRGRAGKPRRASRDRRGGPHAVDARVRPRGADHPPRRAPRNRGGDLRPRSAQRDPGDLVFGEEGRQDHQERRDPHLLAARDARTHGRARRPAVVRDDHLHGAVDDQRLPRRGRSVTARRGVGASLPVVAERRRDSARSSTPAVSSASTGCRPIGCS